MAQTSLKRAGEFIKYLTTPMPRESCSSASPNPMDPISHPIPSRTFVKVYHNGNIKPISPLREIDFGHLELERAHFAKQGLSNGLNGITGRGLGSKNGNHALALFRVV